MKRTILGLLVGALGLCATIGHTQSLPDYVVEAFGTPPPYSADAKLTPDVRNAVEAIVHIASNQSEWFPNDVSYFRTIADTKDPRIAWLLTDMLRFGWRPEFAQIVSQTAAEMIGIELQTGRPWSEITDHLMAWDIPPYPNYLAHKRAVFTRYVDGWEDIFVEGDIEWQLVSWGGVNIDNRPFGRSDEFCNCIPAADNPKVETADQATWLKDSDVVFGIEINGEARAYPRRIMEIREMVNDTLGGRDLGIPYCTLCGAMQAYFTDELPAGVARPILRTSGLLIRSNKVMYDVNSYSVFDTFKGTAVTGPLRGLTLDQATVITTTWGDWKAAYPDTTVLIEALAMGRDFDLRNTRDAGGPIFPVGDVDPRLGVQDDVIGAITASGIPVAFERGDALLSLQNGQAVRFEDVELQLDAGGLRAVNSAGEDIGSHQAFWFAWSQFYPDTAVWRP